MPIWDANNLSAPHTQRELDDVPNGERETPPELAEGMLALKALLTRIVAAESELTTERAKVARLVEAAVYLRDDMLERAECGIDRINGEQYRVVNAGNGAWVGFIEALAAYEVEK